MSVFFGGVLFFLSAVSYFFAIIITFPTDVVVIEPTYLQECGTYFFLVLVAVFGFAGLFFLWKSILKTRFFLKVLAIMIFCLNFFWIFVISLSAFIVFLEWL